jgi:hypothetical protein
VSDARKIQDILGRVKTRFRWLSIASVVAGLIAMILLAIAAEVAIDELLPLPRWIRVLSLVGGVGFTIWLGHRLLSGPLSGRVNDLFLAHSIEGQYANLKSGLITYVQLSTEGEESAALRELVGERVAEDLGAVRPEIVVPSRDALRKALVLGGAFVFCLILFVLSPSGFWLSFRRTLLPIKNLTETQIAEILPGDATSYKGKDVEIAVRLTGKLPATARLRVSRPSSETLKFDLPQRTEGWYRCLLPGVTEGFTYVITAHDASSDEYRIRVADVPRLKSLAATLQFPKYTGFPAKKQDSGNLDAIEGTEVTLEGSSTRALRSAALVMKGKRIAGTDVRGDRFTLRFALSESLEYAIELTDRDGTVDPEPSKFRAVVRKDSAPQVTLTVPGKNVEVAEPSAVHLACRVVDDFGITALQLTARVNGKNPKVVALPFPKERLFLSEATLDLKALDVGPGDYVEYYLTATDNKEPSPQTGQSASYVVTVQSSLPLLTFTDAHPDVRVEKYRDPLDRKGSAEAKSEKLVADDRTKDQGKIQEPPRRELSKKEVLKFEEKKPVSRKDESAGGEPLRGESDSAREDALTKLLEEKKDLIERLLAKAGGKDGPGDSRLQARDGAGNRDGEGKDDTGEARKGQENPGAGNESSDRAPADRNRELAREGDAKRPGKEGSGSKARAGKNGGLGEGAESGDGQGAGENADDGHAGEPGYDTAEVRKPGKNSGATAKGGSKGNGKASKPGRAGKPGRDNNGDGEGGDGDDSDGGDDMGADGDDEDDYDLAQLFPFTQPGGT